MDPIASDQSVMESVRLLLTGAIDYAGLFPPAALSMPEAVLNYATYKTSNYSWMLGRFVVGASRLPEFFEAAVDFISRDQARAWRLAVVAGDDAFEALRLIDDFNAANGPGVICDVVEVKALTSYEIEKVSAALPTAVSAYFEIAPRDGFADLIATTAIAGQRAKIRTGGVTTEAFPTSKEIVRFVQVCAAANIPFKATAGLHHPIKSFRPLTYEANSPKGTMHGFLNLFLMAGFVREAYRRSLLEDVMEEEFDEVFQFDPTGVKWRGEYTLGLWQIERLRQYGIHSFGACSFDEPITDLQTLGIL